MSFTELFNELVDKLDTTNLLEDLYKLEIQYKDLCVRYKRKKKYFEGKSYAYTGAEKYFDFINEMHIMHLVDPNKHNDSTSLLMCVNNYLFSKEAFEFSPFRLFELIEHQYCNHYVKDNRFFYVFQLSKTKDNFEIGFEYFQLTSDKIIILKLNGRFYQYKNENTYHMMLLIYKKIYKYSIVSEKIQ